MIKVNIHITKSISDGIASVKINKIIAPLINASEWNFEPTYDTSNIRVYEEYETHKKILQTFSTPLDSFDLKEGDGYTYHYFKYVIKQTKEALKNYNEHEKIHREERELFLSYWHGTEVVTIGENDD